MCYLFENKQVVPRYTKVFVIWCSIVQKKKYNIKQVHKSFFSAVLFIDC